MRNTDTLRRVLLSLLSLVLGGIGLSVATAQTATASPVQAAVMAPAQKAAPAQVSEKVLPIDYKEQANFYNCGPAAGRNALTALGKNPSVDELGQQMGTTTEGTNSVHEITKGLNSVLGGPVYTAHDLHGQPANAAQMDQFRVDIINAVNSGRPIIVNVTGDWTDTTGRTHGPLEGHYIAVTGYKAGGAEMSIADSAATLGPTSYDMTTKELAEAMGIKGYVA